MAGHRPVIEWWFNDCLRRVLQKLDAIIGNQDVILSKLDDQRKLIMALKDDLASAVNGFTAALAALDSAIKAEIAALQAALGGATDPALTAAVQSAITNLQSATSDAQAQTTALTQSLPPVPPPP
jgi:peptidoglycan hydrolase CwlO-like protein